MANGPDARVAVYIDFDNIVISRFAQLRHGTGVPATNLRDYDPRSVPTPALKTLIKDATVDISAVLDFASSFGDIVLSRAYADWSVPLNASYASQLVGRAVDLVQMFPTVASKTKNGADIRLAVDVIEDLFRLPQLTHVFIIAGDSDYIALAQRSKRLGRSVIGVGVAGSSSASLAAACDEFFNYDELPGVKDADVAVAAIEAAEKPRSAAATSIAKTGRRSASPPTPAKGPAGLLFRALTLLHAKDDAEWITLSLLKAQMLRMDPEFNEKASGDANFTAFLKRYQSFAELEDSSGIRMARLHARWREPAA